MVHRRWTIAIWLLLFAVACSGALRLEFSYDYRSFFDTANPELQAFDAIEQQFSATDSVNFVLHMPDGDVFSREAMQTLDWLTERVLAIPYASRSQSPANYQYSYAFEEDLIVEPLFAPGKGSDFADDNARSTIRTRALDEDGLIGRLISTDLKTAQVIATIRLPLDEGNVLPAVAAEVKAIQEELSARAPQIRVATTGVVMLSQTFFEITLRDMLVLFPLVTITVICLLTWFFRSWKAAALCMFIITASIAMAMGLAGWVGIKLTPATGPAPIIILTIALVDSVHWLSTYFKKRAEGQDELSSARYSTAHNLRAILLTSVTTAIGFLSLNFSDTPPFRELGSISAVGTLIALLLSVTLLPALTQFSRADAAPHASTRRTALLRSFAGLSERLRWAIVGLAAVTALLSAYQVRDLEIRDNFVEWVGTGHPFRADAQFIQSTLPSLFTQQYALEAKSTNGVTTPEYLRDLERFAGFIKTQPGVSHVLSFDSIMRRLNKNLHDDDTAFDRLPDEADEGAQYLLLYEMSLPFGEDLTTLLTIDRSATRVVVTLKPQSSAQMQALRGDILSWAEGNLQQSKASAGTGTNMIFAELTRSNTRSMFFGSLVAASAISLALIVALRNPRLGLLSLVPNVAPPLYAFAVWAVTVESLGLYGAFVVATTLGLIVDATVHMLEKYQSIAHAGSHEPVTAMLEDVGGAILISSIILVAGFGVLTFSNFAIISDLSKLAVLTLGFAVVTDFLLLPALLHIFKPSHAAAAPPDAAL